MRAVADYLLPIADREPLAWIIAHQRTAVGLHRRREAEALRSGDQVFLYTTRGCFRNPTRDRGRVIGAALVRGRAREVSTPKRFADREYPIEIDLRIMSLALRGAGVELAPLVAHLESFPNRQGWSAYIRRALVPLTPGDATKIASALERLAGRYSESAASYVA
jgi:hypothetical protein